MLIRSKTNFFNATLVQMLAPQNDDQHLQSADQCVLVPPSLDNATCRVQPSVQSAYHKWHGCYWIIKRTTRVITHLLLIKKMSISWLGTIKSSLICHEHTILFSFERSAILVIQKVFLKYWKRTTILVSASSLHHITSLTCSKREMHQLLASPLLQYQSFLVYSPSYMQLICC